MSDFADTSAKVLPADAVGPWCEARRRQSQAIVFTNGCFDLLHAGHVAYLEASRRLGDLLVVGLNTDASVRRLKGPSRPIQPQADRARVLAGLACVDAVALFDEDTPLELIRTVQPDVLTKGKDYARVEDIVGWDVVQARGGRVERIDLLPGRSTTGLIDRLDR